MPFHCFPQAPGPEPGQRTNRQTSCHQTSALNKCEHGNSKMRALPGRCMPWKQAQQAQSSCAKCKRRSMKRRVGACKNRASAVACERALTWRWWNARVSTRWHASECSLKANRSTQPPPLYFTARHAPTRVCKHATVCTAHTHTELVPVPPKDAPGAHGCTGATC